MSEQRQRRVQRERQRSAKGQQGTPAEGALRPNASSAYQEQDEVMRQRFDAALAAGIVITAGVGPSLPLNQQQQQQVVRPDSPPVRSLSNEAFVQGFHQLPGE